MIDVSKLKVLNDNVLVVGLQPEERGGIIRGVTSDNKPEIGRVLKVGPGRVLDNGERVETGVIPGSLVVFNPYTTTKFNFDGGAYYVLRAEDIIGYQYDEDKAEING